MKPPRLKEILLLILCITGALLLFYAPNTQLPEIDEKTDNYFNSAITKAGVAYAACRALNASVSVLKDSDLQLEPAGVGVSLAIGQILDPIDDMTERLSDVLVTAITSIGIQKLIYEISAAVAPSILTILLLILSPLLLFKNDRVASFKGFIIRMMFLVLIARFCFPISAVANTFLQKNFFEDRIEDARRKITIESFDIKKFTDFTLPESDSMLKTIENSAALLKRKSIDFKNALVETIHNSGGIIENLIKLTFLYTSVFLVQVILLPILIFWLLLKTANTIFEPIFHRPPNRFKRNGMNIDGEKVR